MVRDAADNNLPTNPSDSAANQVPSPTHPPSTLGEGPWDAGVGDAETMVKSSADSPQDSPTLAPPSAISSPSGAAPSGTAFDDQSGPPTLIPGTSTGDSSFGSGFDSGTAPIASREVDPEGTIVSHVEFDPNGTIVSISDAGPNGTRIDRSALPPDATAIEGTFPGLPPRPPVELGPVTEKVDAERYELVDNFAKGGLGNIWRARDERLQREVAFKELLPAALKNPAFFERFLEEAQITGQLEHPGIVPIYDLGWQANGTPYYSMKLVRGHTYLKAIQVFHKLKGDTPERHLAYARLLRQFVDVCNAIAFAHDRGVLHRDLKPHNIMLGAFGETLVLDWGLAKIIGAPEKPVFNSSTPGELPLGSVTLPGSSPTSVTSPSIRRSVVTNVRSQASQTIMGSIMGTPSYMPPEQARGENDTLDPRADIYSLGAILYELLTGRQAVQKDKVVLMLKRVTTGDFPSPRKVDPRIDRPIEAICLKAMSVRREDRYETALELARDVERYLADEPVSVFREPWSKRARRWMRRHRLIVTTTAGVLLAGGISAAAWRVSETRRVDLIATHVQDALVTIDRDLAAGRFAAAREKLAEAQGEIRDEQTLASLIAAVDEKKAAIDTLAERAEANRLKELKEDVTAQLQVANRELTTHRDPASAQALLSKIVTLLRDEPTLASLRTDAETRLKAATTELALKRDSEAATTRLADFFRKLDEARFYGSQFTGERPEDNTRSALAAATDALRLYDPEKAEALSVHSLGERARGLDPAQQARLQTGLHETGLILAEATSQQATRAAEADRSPLRQTALQWLDRTEAAGLKSRVVYELRSRLLREEGRTEPADAAAETARTLDPATAWEYVSLGELQRQSEGEPLSALPFYQKALERDPDFHLALYFTGVANLQHVQKLEVPAGKEQDADIRGYLTASVTAFTACLAQRPEFVWPLLLRGVAQAGLGEAALAEADFALASKAAEKGDGILPASLYAYGLAMNRGSLRYQQLRYDDAQAEFSRAESLRPGQPEALINLSLVERAKQRDSQALALLTRALEADPRNRQAWRLRAEVQQRLGDDTAAEKDNRAWLGLAEAATEQARALVEIGKLYQRAGTLAEAVRAYREAVTLDRTNGVAWRLLGEALLARGESQAAEDAFGEALTRLDPVGDLYRARGLTRASQGRYRDAMNDYTRSLELESSPNILTRRGWAYLMQARQLALADFDEAIRLNPENGDSYNGRGYARILLGQVDEATADAEESLRRGPKAFEIYFNAAAIYGQAVGVVTRDSRLSTEDRQKRLEFLTNRTIEILKDARILLGPDRAALLKRAIASDEAFLPLDAQPAWKAFVSDLP